MKKLFLLAAMYVLVINSAAQSVGVGTVTPNASAQLDITSTSKGLLIPRMTKLQKNAIASPATGLLVYQTGPDSTGFHYYAGSSWVWLEPLSATAWKTTGNAVTDTAVNFIGTTDNMPLAFRVNNENSGRIENNITSANSFLGFHSGRLTTGNFNTAFGNRAMSLNTTGNSNVALGAFSLAGNVNGNDNIAIGNSALLSQSGSPANIGIGTNALRNNITGPGLVAIGHEALASNTSGTINMAIGYEGLTSNTTGSNNIAFGFQSLRSNTSGLLNYGIGYQSLFSNTTGGYNLAIGMEALKANTNGFSNIAIGGWQNMYNNTTGVGNISVGAEWPNASLYNNTTGSRNISIGSNLFSNTTGTNNIALGYLALNNSQIKSDNIAIGTAALLSNGINAPLAMQAVGNTGIGTGALNGNYKGSYNTAIGYSTATLDTAQSFNTAVGAYSLNAGKGNRNTAVGYSALLNSQGSSNVAIGEQALMDSAGNNNVAVGAEALKNNEGSHNVAMGYKGLLNNRTGNNNIAIGDSAASTSTGVSEIVAIGTKALLRNISGVDNTAIGSNTLSLNTTGAFNTGVGSYALFRNTSGFWNTALGTSAMFDNTGNRNVAVGVAALGAVSSGSNNVAIGAYAGYGSTGSGNIFIGSETGMAPNSYSDKLIIDNSDNANPLIWGDFFLNRLRINGRLDINNQYLFPLFDGAANQVLSTDGAGVVSWSNAVFSANNGLTLGAGNVALGGTLSSNTTITQGAANFTHYLGGTGDFLITTPSSTAFTVLQNGATGFSTTAPVAIIDANGDLALRQNEITVSNGTNNDVNTGPFSFIKIAGPSAAFSLSGFTGGVDGKILTVLNLTGQNMTIVNQGGSASLAANRINTLSGADIVTTGNGSVTMQYSAADSRWMVIAVRD